MTATAGGLAARLARLEQKVSQLQAQAGGGEQLSPNYLTLDAFGNVGADFTGLVNALGLIIPAGTVQQPPQLATDQIVWEAAGGVFVANVQAFSNGVVGSGTRQVNVSSTAVGFGDENGASLTALSDGGDPNRVNDSAKIQITQRNRGAVGPPGTIGGWTEVDAFAGLAARMILDASNRSSYVQVGSPLIPRTIEVDFGSVNVAFSGGNSSNLVTAFADLDPNPTSIVVLATSSSGIGINAQAGVASTNPVQVSIQGDYPFGVLTGNFPISWFAIAGY